MPPGPFLAEMLDFLVVFGGCVEVAVRDGHVRGVVDRLAALFDNEAIGEISPVFDRVGPVEG